MANLKALFKYGAGLESSFALVLSYFEQIFRRT